MYIGSEVGLYLRLIDFVYHLRVIKKKGADREGEEDDSQRRDERGAHMLLRREEDVPGLGFRV